MRQKWIWDKHFSYYTSENNHNRQYKTVGILMDNYTTKREKQKTAVIFYSEMTQHRVWYAAEKDMKIRRTALCTSEEITQL